MFPTGERLAEILGKYKNAEDVIYEGAPSGFQAFVVSEKKAWWLRQLEATGMPLDTPMPAGENAGTFDEDKFAGLTMAEIVAKGTGSADTPGILDLTPIIAQLQRDGFTDFVAMGPHGIVRPPRDQVVSPVFLFPYMQQAEIDAYEHPVYSTDTHAIDTADKGTVATVTQPGTIVITHPTEPTVTAEIPEGDVLNTLPRGATVETGPSKVTLTLPAKSPDEASVVVHGETLFQAVAQVWHLLTDDAKKLFRRIHL